MCCRPSKSGISGPRRLGESSGWSGIPADDSGGGTNLTATARVGIGKLKTPWISRNLRSNRGPAEVMKRLELAA